MEKITKIGASFFALITKYYWGHKMRDSKMRGTRSTYG
jgi:hypothetical protein